MVSEAYEFRGEFCQEASAEEFEQNIEFGVRIKESMLLRSYEGKKHLEKFIKTRLTYLVKV